VEHTALRLLAGLEAPDSGQVVRDGVVVSEANRIVSAPHQRGVAMVFQDLALWPNLSVLENVVMGQAAVATLVAELRPTLAASALPAVAHDNAEIAGGEKLYLNAAVLLGRDRPNV
jgi:ABC-type Fe3+/spermidine/putrescine transport system ATPase subunit